MTGLHGGELKFANGLVRALINSLSHESRWGKSWFAVEFSTNLLTFRSVVLLSKPFVALSVSNFGN